MIREENGQIIVDELRPMSDAPRDSSTILIGRRDDGICTFPEMIEAFWDGQYWNSCGDEFRDNELTGWLPMPIYRPKDGA